MSNESHKLLFRWDNQLIIGNYAGQRKRLN